MNCTYAWVIWAVLVPLAYGQIQGANDRSTIEKELKQVLEGKVLSLRMPTSSSRLDFDSTGQPVGVISAAPWTTGGLLQVKHIRLKQDVLDMECERVLVALRSGKAATSAELVPIVTGRSTFVNVRIDSSTDSAHISSALGQIFEAVDVQQRISAYWVPSPGTSPDVRSSLAGQVLGLLEGGRPVYRAKSGSVEPPKPTRTPDPEYTEAARRKRLQGTAVLMVVVNEKGVPEILQVVRGLGEGLDVKALAAVSEWRFKPATCNGEPVAVMLNVEVSFRLYN